MHEKKAAKESMTNVALKVRKLRNPSNEDAFMADCDVSLDGTWQKRGFASLNELVTVIERDYDKCIDFEIKSKICKSCNYWNMKKGCDEYDTWKSSHKCLKNHQGSAASMESCSAVELFNRSIALNKLRYVTYNGDGDSASYRHVVDSNPYPDIVIKKGECIGHIQKRMGSRLRKIKQTTPKSFKLSDDKPLFGRGRLTDKTINTLQNYYGEKKGNLYQMKKTIGAILHHYSDIEDPEKRHLYCLRSADSWCKYWSNILTGKQIYKVSKISIPLPIMKELSPIFEDLMKDSLLEKCLHGKTQSVNETLNGLIWKRCPKDIFVSKNVIEIGVSSAIIHFNDGCAGIIPVLEKLGLTFGNMLLNSDT